MSTHLPGFQSFYSRQPNSPAAAKSSVWNYDACDNIVVIENDFTRYLKESGW